MTAARKGFWRDLEQTQPYQLASIPSFGIALRDDGAVDIGDTE